MLSWEGYYEKAIELTENELGIDSSNSSIIVLLSDCHKDNGNLDKAIEILNNGLPADNPEIAIASAIIHKEKDDLDKAISVIHSAYMNFPNNELLMFNYSVLLEQKNRFKEALFLFNALTIKYPKNIRYWGNLSNNCLNLDLYDNAMDACKKAEELAQGESAWIQNNIGNLMNNKGFYTEAMQWLNKGLALEPTSQYAHNKLATAIKSKEDEREEFNKYCKEGRKLIRDFSIEPYDKT